MVSDNVAYRLRDPAVVRFLEERIKLAVVANERDRGGPADADSIGFKVDLEWHRFYCGLGLTALAAMLLPQPRPLEQIHRGWLCVLGQRYMDALQPLEGRQ